MDNILKSSDPKQKLLEFNKWNSGKKVFDNNISNNPPTFVTDWISFLTDLPGSPKTYEVGTVPKKTKTVDINNIRSDIKENIEGLNIPEDQKNYLYILGQRESSWNPNAKAGSHVGYYQFNKDSLQTVGMSMEDYLSHPINQHIAALKLRKSNLNSLNKYKDYIGKVVNGVKVTENGLAAAAHLLGAGGVKAFFERGEVKKDGLGTPITEYFELFA